MPAKAPEDPNKPLIAGVLSLILPGAGQWFLQNSERAKAYFLYFLGLWIAAAAVFFISLGICFPVMFVPAIFNIGSAIDAYYEARGEEDKRLLKQYIK